jgi:rRNA-processing protein FCF1
MFGVIKESVLNELESLYKSGETDKLKNEFATYLKNVKKYKGAKLVYEIYSTYDDVIFEDYDVAKEFVDTSLELLKGIKRGSLNGFFKIYESKASEIKNLRYKNLDRLLFEENLTIKERAELKVSLAKSLLKKSNSSVKFSLSEIENRLNEKISVLNEEQREVLGLFLENKQLEIESYYSNLIFETSDLINTKILVTEDTALIKKLAEVQKKLIHYNYEIPNLDNIDKIISLKESIQ